MAYLSFSSLSVVRYPKSAVTASETQSKLVSYRFSRLYLILLVKFKWKLYITHSLTEFDVGKLYSCKLDFIVPLKCRGWYFILSFYYFQYRIISCRYSPCDRFNLFMTEVMAYWFVLYI